jgi:hypothetical protein
MAKMSKSQAKRRLFECRSKLNKVLAADLISIADWTKCQAALVKALNSTKLK